MRCLLIFFLTCCTCAAQSIAIGAIVGGRITADVANFPTSEANLVFGVPAFRLESRFYDVGPTIEVGLPHRLSVEFDAIYHRQGFSSAFYHDTLFTTNYERDNIWEFPLLLKYKVRLLAVHPFVEAGVAPRTINGHANGTGQFVLTPPVTLAPSTPSYPVSYSPSAGFVAGGGIQLDLGHLRLAPQVRYSRWFTTPVSGLEYGIYGGTFSSNLNQVDVLVGISWGLR